MPFYHENLAAGRWQTLSLAEQMGNIGSEIGRAKRWQGRDENLFWGAVRRALELFDFTISDARWRGRLKEITRAREVFCDAAQGGGEYKSNLFDLTSYFDAFAYEARKDK